MYEVPRAHLAQTARDLPRERARRRLGDASVASEKLRDVAARAVLEHQEHRLVLFILDDVQQRDDVLVAARAKHVDLGLQRTKQLAVQTTRADLLDGDPRFRRGVRRVIRVIRVFLEHGRVFLSFRGFHVFRLVTVQQLSRVSTPESVGIRKRRIIRRTRRRRRWWRGGHLAWAPRRFAVGRDARALGNLPRAPHHRERALADLLVQLPSPADHAPRRGGRHRARGAALQTEASNERATSARAKNATPSSRAVLEPPGTEGRARGDARRDEWRARLAQPPAREAASAAERAGVARVACASECLSVTPRETQTRDSHTADP